MQIYILLSSVMYPIFNIINLLDISIIDGNDWRQESEGITLSL